MLKLSIRARIFGGSGLLVLFSVAISAFAVWQLLSITKLTDRTSHFAAQANRIEKVTFGVETMRRMASLYKFDSDLERVDGFKAENKKANIALTEAIDKAVMASDKQAYLSIREKLATLAQKFDDLVTLNMQVDADRELLFKGGDELTSATGKLIAAAREAGRESLASRTEAAILMVRVSNWRFLATRDAKGPATFKKNLERALASLSELEKEDRGGIARLVSPVQSALSSYAKAFEGASEGIVKMDQVYATDLQPLMEEINTSITSTTNRLRAEVDANRKATSDGANDTILFSEIVAVLALLVGGFIAYLVGRSVVKPVVGMTQAMTTLAAGNTSVAVPSLEARDELGAMAKAVEVFRMNAIEVDRMRVAQEADRASTAQRRRTDMMHLANEFEQAVGEIVDTVSSASTELEASANALTATAGHAQDVTTMVAAASEEASTNVQSVASATEELSATVSEIGRQVQESARMAGEAVGQARATMGQIGDLSQASSRIGAVVELIETIASQTNLLALNATIEAARAGDAGRGFAVVASEVKTLADQTAKATREIGQQIDGIQAATSQSVIAIKEISGTIERLSEISSTIAAAVEEQGATTQEIARNVQQAALGTQQVSANIADVQRGAAETGGASSQVLSSAQLLSTDSMRLKARVRDFLDTVRAA